VCMCIYTLEGRGREGQFSWVLSCNNWVDYCLDFNLCLFPSRSGPEDCELRLWDLRTAQGVLRLSVKQPCIALQWAAFPSVPLSSSSPSPTHSPNQETEGSPGAGLPSSSSFSPSSPIAVLHTSSMLRMYDPRAGRASAAEVKVPGRASGLRFIPSASSPAHIPYSLVTVSTDRGLRRQLCCWDLRKSQTPVGSYTTAPWESPSRPYLFYFASPDQRSGQSGSTGYLALSAKASTSIQFFSANSRLVSCGSYGLGSAALSMGVGASTHRRSLPPVYWVSRDMRLQSLKASKKKHVLGKHAGAPGNRSAPILIFLCLMKICMWHI